MTVMQLPIVPSSPVQSRNLSSLADFVILAKKSNDPALRATIHFLEDLIDACVFELYYLEHMQEKQIDIFQFLKNDLGEVVQGRNFEQLSDSDKGNIINQLYAKWAHPDNEIRNRIKLFALRSPDILKPILENR